MNQPMNIDVQDIDHLGLIAGIVDEIGIVEIINRLLGTHPLEEVSAGHVVKALILNCLGFLTAPLYLFRQFFESKATEHLIGAGVKPEHLNDSRIGRVLDQLYQKGLTHVFMEIADADQAVFTEVIAQFQQQWKAAEPEVYVADAALYSQENIETLGETPWIKYLYKINCPPWAAWEQGAGSREKGI